MNHERQCLIVNVALSHNFYYAYIALTRIACIFSLYIYSCNTGLPHCILRILCKLIKAPLQLLYTSAYIQLITFEILMHGVTVQTS